MSSISERNIALGGQDLQPYRQQLDQINNALVDLLAQRMEICRVIARIKSAKKIPMMQPHRVTSTLDTVRSLAPSCKLRPDYLGDLFALIIKETCNEEQRLMDALDQPGVEE
ncbi:chorismate mutase [Pseudomonas ogarae]|uniref:chorismate mutase n=1 Tax=Pseudomonas ogarae (strain DSM 112162 / CECT 30235 / F113) TaxID=1114970 RepID=A0ABN5GE78_PSEO1|nr:chorismate mutase [Pseudomonas ogarae]AUO49393.1 chorismate mutase [Pseudomonas ogarae]